MEKVFFEYSENSVMLYDALQNANPPSDMVAIFNKFQKQLYSYSEFEIKHFKKLQPFAENKQLVNFVCNLLNKVCPHYENKEFYYILVVLSYSKEQKAMEYLDLLTEFVIANELNLCHILLTIFNETASPQVLLNKKKLEQYFEVLYLQSDYFEFVKRVGLDTSKMEFQKTGGEGYFRFDLTNMEGIQYAFQLDDETVKRKFCKLSISVFAPKGMKSCFDISLTSEEFLLYHHHKDYCVSSNRFLRQNGKTSFHYHHHKDYCVSSKEEIKLLKKETNQTFYIENGTDLLELKNIVKQIEDVLETKFVSDIVSSHFTKPLKGKKELQKWWKEESSISE